MSLNILIIILIICAIYIFCNKDYFTSYFENFNGSGYGFRKTFSELTTFTPLNIIDKSSDFKLLSFINQLKSQTIKDQNYVITKTDQGIISKTSDEYPNVIIFPSISDIIINNDNNKQIWPNSIDKKELSNSEYKSLQINSNGHLNEVYYLLQSIGYKNINSLSLQLRANQNKYNSETNISKVNSIVYNFIDINIDNVKKQFRSLLENYSKYKNKNTIIITYDNGCILANICLLYLKEKDNELYNQVKKCIMISPTFGGSALSIKDFINAYKNKDKYKYLSDSLLLNLPIKEFYKNPILILDSVGYKPNDILEIFKLLKIDKKEMQILEKKLKFNQELHKYSLNDTGIKTQIIYSQYSNKNDNQTPVCYNYMNNLFKSPERYYLPNNNKTGSYQSINNVNGTIEGLTEDGDNIIPESNINILKNTNKDIIFNLVKNKNHFNILKSYELALLISSNII